MSTDIFDFPPVERPYVAVRRFKIIYGETIFNDLLEYLGVSEDEFRCEYGEKLIGNPTVLNGVITDMVVGRIRQMRRRCGVNE